MSVDFNHGHQIPGAAWGYIRPDRFSFITDIEELGIASLLGSLVRNYVLLSV